LKKAAILRTNNEVGDGYANAFIEEFKKYDGITTINEAYDTEEEFNTKLLKIKSKSPDIIFLAGCKGKTIAKIIQIANLLEIEAVFVGTTTTQDKIVIEIGGESVEGLYYSYPDFDANSVTSTKAKNFVKNYELMYGEKPEIAAANNYDAMYIIAKAIENCGNAEDTDCIRDELYATQNYEGVTGIQSFDENGDVEKEVIIKQIQDGEFVAVT